MGLEYTFNLSLNKVYPLCYQDPFKNFTACEFVHTRITQANSGLIKSAHMQVMGQTLGIWGFFCLGGVLNKCFTLSERVLDQ